MTEEQREYLRLLSDEAGEALDENLSEAQARKRIEELRERTGRGVHEHDPGQPGADVEADEDTLVEQLDEEGKLGA
jgi:hypothetical protein